jgi:hypothetical protein
MQHFPSSSLIQQMQAGQVTNSKVMNDNTTGTFVVAAKINSGSLAKSELLVPPVVAVVTDSASDTQSITTKIGTREATKNLPILAILDVVARP